jgi:hypothetical protein
MLEAGDVVFLQWDKRSIAQRFFALTSASGTQPVLLVRESVYQWSKATCVDIHWDTGKSEKAYLLLDDPVTWPCNGVEGIIKDQETPEGKDIFLGYQKLSLEGLATIWKAALNSGMGSDYQDMIRRQS